MPSELQVTASTVIHRPLAEVFDQVCDVERAGEWIPFCDDSEMLERSTHEASHRGIGRGMRARFRFRLTLGLELEVLQEVTEFVWGKHLLFRTWRSPQQPATALTGLLAPFIPRTAMRFSFEPSHSGTVVTVHLSIWILHPGFADLNRPAAAEAVTQSLANLKRTIEQSERPPHAPWIFFSYRREAETFASDRIHASLRREFGEAAIYRDLFHIQGGARVEASVKDAIQDSMVFVAILGVGWPARGEPHQDTGRDWVLDELAWALAEPEVTVLPVLIDRAELPARHTLRDDVRELHDRNALRVRREPDFDQDMSVLIAALWDVYRRRHVARGSGEHQIAMTRRAGPA